MITPEATVLGIESSCDESAAAIWAGGQIRASVVQTQASHAAYGGVVPELAARLHEVQVPAAVEAALRQAGCTYQHLDAIAYTAGPGLMGALLVGASFAKGLAWALGKPLVPVNHLQGHRLSLLLAEGPPPDLPALVLTASGGHTQLDVLESPLEARTLGATRDDAAGEAFDKAAKLLGLPFPGGPALDRLAEAGDASRHPLAIPDTPGLEFSFSGLKTSFLYYLQRHEAKDPGFVQREAAHLAAALRQRVVEALLGKLFQAQEETGLRTLGIVGGVSANALLRRRFEAECQRRGIRGVLPPLAYCMDNAAMIALAGAHLLAAGQVGNAYSTAFPTGSA